MARKAFNEWAFFASAVLALQLQFGFCPSKTKVNLAGSAGLTSAFPLIYGAGLRHLLFAMMIKHKWRRFVIFGAADIDEPQPTQG